MKNKHHLVLMNATLLFAESALKVRNKIKSRKTQNTTIFLKNRQNISEKSDKTDK